MTENNENENEVIDKTADRKNAMNFDRANFARLIINDLSSNKSGRGFMRKYKQSEVRDIIEGYKLEKNQLKLREISQLLWAKSPQYQRLIEYFSGMSLFAHIISPVKDIRSLNKKKVLKQYTDMGEFLKTLNLRHEMNKVLSVVFREDIFYGYVHRDGKAFHIQQMDSNICKATAIEGGVLNYSIDMGVFLRNDKLLIGMADEIKIKFREWKAMKSVNNLISSWVELDAKNTICIKLNEDIREIFPPFAGSFDAIFDIEGFKQLRKDKEELGNYMVLTQKLPMRTESDNNNDFLIDENMFKYFHNMVSGIVPENVGVVTSPMEIEQIKFDHDRADRDGVAKAERDLFSGIGVSQLLFNADKSTSQGLLMSIKTDEEIVFTVLTQVERWLNRYLGFNFNDMMFNVHILPVTRFNQSEMYKMYLENAQYGLPVKSHLSATIGLDPIETMNMVYLENDLLGMNEEFIPLQSSHTMSNEEEVEAPKKAKAVEGRPKKDTKKVSDETARSKDKPNA